jgi:3',5'-cyclic AMP phosphodiesterase CpdA
MVTCNGEGSVFAVSDLHVTHPENRRLVERIHPESPHDWLLVGGDISEDLEDVEWVVRMLGERYATVVWVPGNHELWTQPTDRLPLRGVRRYQRLVEICRAAGVVTPEDPYPIWEGSGGPVTIAPLFLLYDYTFGCNVAPTKEEALAIAHDVGVVCSDEFLLSPEPYGSREAWCRARVRETEIRLEACDTACPTILVNHFPLSDHPTRALFHPEFAQWCGTELTRDWHRRFRALAVVYGHLHIPRTTWQDGVRFEEVSLGFPRERNRHPGQVTLPKRIMPWVRP